MVRDLFSQVFVWYSYVWIHPKKKDLLSLRVKKWVISSYDRLDNFTKMIVWPDNTCIWYVKTSNRHKNKDTTYYVTNNQCFISEHALSQENAYDIVIKQPFRTEKDIWFRVGLSLFFIFMILNAIASFWEYSVIRSLSEYARSYWVDWWWFILALVILLTYVLYERHARDVKKKAIYLDHPEFEKKFDTICDDQIFPRTILDADTMQHIVQWVWDEYKAYSFFFQQKALFMKYSLEWKRIDHLFLLSTKPSRISEKSFIHAHNYMNMVTSIVKYCNL